MLVLKKKKPLNQAFHFNKVNSSVDKKKTLNQAFYFNKANSFDTEAQFLGLVLTKFKGKVS